MKLLFNTGHEVKAVFDIDKIVAAIASAQDDYCLSEAYTEQEQENYHKYIRILAEIDWPAYINGDSQFHEYVIEQYEESGQEGVINTIYQYYDALYLKNLEDQISESEVVDHNRAPLFHEAFLLYQLGYYYGAVSILITQLIGITADIEKYLKARNTSYDPVTLKKIQKKYGFQVKNDTARVMTAVLESKEIDDEQGEYGYLMGYLRFKIFRTKIPKMEIKEELAKHPNRNLICHGVQLNYGTKEHAMKAILCIDALAWVAEVVAEDYKDG